MNNVLYCIVLCLILPVALLCIFLEHRGRRIMLSFVSGVIACLLAYFINNQLSSLMGGFGGSYTYTMVSVVEETLKLIPILAFSLILKKGLKGSTALAFSVGVGFCVVENFYYLYSDLSNAGILWIVVRCIGTGLMHSMSASIIGLGIYFSRQKGKKYIWLPVVTFIAAIVYHGLYNFLVQSGTLQWVGIALPAVTCIAVFIISHKTELLRFWHDSEE